MAHGRGYRPRKCKDCGKPRTPEREISFRGLCEPCREARMIGTTLSMYEKSGEAYERWREGMRRAADQ